MPRRGARQLRDLSTMIRPENGATGMRRVSRVNWADPRLVPPFDPSGNTLFLGVSIRFERLCDMAERLAARGP